jgi:hypothetical protein
MAGAWYHIEYHPSCLENIVAPCFSRLLFDEK